jgi:hypothetical protein
MEGRTRLSANICNEIEHRKNQHEMFLKERATLDAQATEAREPSLRQRRRCAAAEDADDDDKNEGFPAVAAAAAASAVASVEGRGRSNKPCSSMLLLILFGVAATTARRGDVGSGLPVRVW